jgi:virginiamycin A acetyltransferase
MSIVDSAVMAVRLYLWRRRQMDNDKLREFFHQRYDISVGRYSYGCFDRWRLPGPMSVGRYCSFASTVRRAPANHAMDGLTTHPALYDPALGVVAKDLSHNRSLVVEDDVWIGHYVMILPGCARIGRGAVIGAGAIVTRDVPAYAVVVGNPARVLRKRFEPDAIEALETSRWWELDLGGLAELARDHEDLVFHPTAEALQAWVSEKRDGAG